MPWWGQILIVFGVVVVGGAVAVVLLKFGLQALVKFRLIPAAIYSLAVWVSTFFTDWATEHRTLVIIGLCVIIATTGISWIVTLVKHIKHKRFFEEDVAWQLQRAREMGKVVDSITIGEDGTVRDAKTGEPIIK